MVNFTEIGGKSVRVEAWKYVVHNDGAGLDKYPVVQFKNADRDVIERQMAQDENLKASDFEALVSADDVRSVIDDG